MHVFIPMDMHASKRTWLDTCKHIHMYVYMTVGQNHARVLVWAQVWVQVCVHVCTGLLPACATCACADACLVVCASTSVCTCMFACRCWRTCRCTLYLNMTAYMYACVLHVYVWLCQFPCMCSYVLPCMCTCVCTCMHEHACVFLAWWLTWALCRSCWWQEHLICASVAHNPCRHMELVRPATRCNARRPNNTW